MKIGNNRIGAFILDDGVILSFWFRIGEKRLFTMGAMIEPRYIPEV